MVKATRHQSPRSADRPFPKYTGKEGLAQDQIGEEWFRKFQTLALPPWLKEGLDELRVWPVSAYLFQNGPRWNMERRKLGDDLFFLVLAGSGEAEVGSARGPLSPGMCAHSLRGVPHAATQNARDPMTVITIHYSATLFESLNFPQVMGFPPFFDFRDDPGMQKLFMEACRVNSLHPPGWEFGLSVIASQILLTILWDYGHLLKPQLFGTNAADYRRLAPALAYLRNNLSDSPPIVDLAKRAGTSESQFRRIFKRALGRSPIKYIQHLRMERACDLLRATDLTIEAIADKLGYSETSFFANSFREHIGVPPGLFRHRAASERNGVHVPHEMLAPASPTGRNRVSLKK